MFPGNIWYDVHVCVDHKITKSIVTWHIAILIHGSFCQAVGGVDTDSNSDEWIILDCM